MEKVYLFLRKLVAFTLNAMIFFAIDSYVPFFYSIPILLIIFSLISARITNTTPKELYNYQRSEKYFSQGGLRDLLRIPVMLFAFLYDIIVWIVWGLYQVLLLITDFIYFIKEIIFWIFQGGIWFLQQLLPFWRIVGRMFLYYLVKWPWWIYRYSFKAVKKSFNWNILRVSAIGAFISLFIVHLFYYLDTTLGILGLYIIGIILAMLPVSWVFGEISSIRGQKLMFVPYSEVRLKMRNGLETVRGILFFITLFVVLLFTETALGLLGWIPRSGIVFLGISLNISFILTIILILLGVLIVLGSIVLPSYRLYNEFSETSLKDNYRLLTHLVKRSLQYLAGIIPSFIFAIITIVPISVVVVFTLTLTMQLKENITEVKIDKLLLGQSNAHSQLVDYKIGKEIERLRYVKIFPKQFFQDVNHRILIKDELEDYIETKEKRQLEQAKFQSKVNEEKQMLNNNIVVEQNKVVANQTRIDEITNNISLLEDSYKVFEQKTNAEIEMLDVEIEYAQRQFKQAGILFYLGGFFAVVFLALILTFVLAYYGNLYYRTFLFKNDGLSAKWKEFIQFEQLENINQPLLSTTLNILIVAGIIVLFMIF
jgi:hypothetical protein